MKDLGEMPKQHSPIYAEQSAGERPCPLATTTGGAMATAKGEKIALKGSYSRLPNGAFPQACRCAGSVCPLWRWAEDEYEWSDVEKPALEGWEPKMLMPPHDQPNEAPRTLFRRFRGPIRRGYCGQAGEPRIA